MIRGAQRVECALEDVAERVRRYVPDARFILKPLESVGGRLVRRPELAEDQKLRVAVIGHCSAAKGGNLLLDCIEVSQREDAPIEWSVIGSFAGSDLARVRKMQHAVAVTGPYESSQLCRLIADVDPHLLLFPQRCVETWSYALTEAIESGRMILAPHLGAFRERLRGVAGAYHYDESASSAEIVGQIMNVRSACFAV